MPTSLASSPRLLLPRLLVKSNSNHDPKTGRFAFGRTTITSVLGAGGGAGGGGGPLDFYDQFLIAQKDAPPLGVSGNGMPGEFSGRSVLQPFGGGDDTIPKPAGASKPARLKKSIPVLLLKTHVSGYTRKDGAYVAPHEDKRPKPDAGSFTTQGNQRPIASRPDPTGTLSPEATGWLYAYQWGIGGVNSADVKNPVPSEAVMRELSAWCAKSPISVYRAVYEDADDTGKQVESWTRYSDHADAIAQASDGRRMKVIRRVVQPDEVIVDTTRLPKKFKDEHDAGTQDEVVIALGPLKERLKAARAAPDRPAKHSPEQMAKWAEEKRQRDHARVEAFAQTEAENKRLTQKSADGVDSSSFGPSFTDDEKAEIKRYYLSGDRRGANAEGRAAAISALERLLRQQGVEIEHVSESEGKSLYVKVGGKLVRVSDHELPMTPKRENDRANGLTGRWDREVIITDWRSTPPQEYLDEIHGRLEKAAPILVVKSGEFKGKPGYSLEGKPPRWHAHGVDTIQEVIDAARQPGHAPHNADLGEASPWLVQQAAEKAHLQIAGCRHVIDGSAVWHIIKRHTNAAVEKSRGQLPLTEADIEAIPLVIASADRVVFGTKTRLKRDQIGYIKKMADGSLLYLEEVRAGRQELATVSMRKYPAARDFSAIAGTLPSNARSDGGDEVIVLTPPVKGNPGGPLKKAILFFKAHIKGYTKKDGTFVSPHEDKRPSAKEPEAWAIPASAWPQNGDTPQVLFHNSPEADSFEVNDGGLFGGIFAGPEAGMGGMDSHLHAVILDPDKIMTHQDFSYHVDYGVYDKAIADALPGLSEQQRQELWDYVAEEMDDDDGLKELLGIKDTGDALWELQRLRGVVARAAGYDAAEMEDETGISTLVLPGARTYPLKDGETIRAAEARIYDEWRAWKAGGMVVKAHVKGYARKDGVYVSAHEDRRPSAGRPVGRTVTPDSNLYDGSTIRDGKGRLYRVAYQRGREVIAHPIVGGRPNVSRDTAVNFWVGFDNYEPPSDSYRTDPVYLIASPHEDVAARPAPDIQDAGPIKASTLREHSRHYVPLPTGLAALKPIGLTAANGGAVVNQIEAFHAGGDLEKLQNIKGNLFTPTGWDGSPILYQGAQKKAVAAYLDAAIADLQAKAPPAAAAQPGPAQIKWDDHKLGAANVNAKSHNGQIDKIRALADAGDAAGLEAYIAAKAGAKQNYAIKQRKLAEAALASLKPAQAPITKAIPVYVLRRFNAAASQAATSPSNSLPEPTQAQKESGNYKKGHVTLQGLDISIENPRGSERAGTNPDGTAWRHVMSDHYGYIKRTEGADGDAVDVYVGPALDSDRVFVVNQINQKTGKFDEHKVMLGFDSQAAAVKAYRSNFDPGWKVGPVHAMSMAEFKDWLKDGDTTRPTMPMAKAAPIVFVRVPRPEPRLLLFLRPGDPLAKAMRPIRGYVRGGRYVGAYTAERKIGAVKESNKSAGSPGERGESEDSEKPAVKPGWKFAYDLGSRLRSENGGEPLRIFDFENLPESVVRRIGSFGPISSAFFESGMRGAKMPEWGRGTRYGGLPEEGFSRNHVDGGGREHGVSMASVDGHDYQWYPMGGHIGARASRYEGWVLDPDAFWGSDGEPLMVGLRPVAGLVKKPSKPAGASGAALGVADRHAKQIAKWPARRAVAAVAVQLEAPERVQETMQFMRGSAVAEASAGALAAGPGESKLPKPTAERVDGWFDDERANRKPVSADIGIQVEITKATIKDSVYHGARAEKLAAFTILPKVIERGRALSVELAYLGNNLDRTVIGAPVKIGGVDHLMGVLLQTTERGASYYIHDVTLTPKGKPSVPMPTRSVAGNAFEKGREHQGFVSIVLQSAYEGKPPSEAIKTHAALRAKPGGGSQK